MTYGLSWVTCSTGSHEGGGLPMSIIGLRDDFILERFVPSAGWIVIALLCTAEEILTAAGFDAVAFSIMLVFRRFTCNNLMQLNYILPEAIVISMILLRDEKSFCMKPDLQVNLFVDAVEGSMMQKGGTRYLALRKIFRQSCGFLQEPPCGRKKFRSMSCHIRLLGQNQAVLRSHQEFVPEAESSMPSPCLGEQQLCRDVAHVTFLQEKVLQVRLKSNWFAARVFQSGSLRRLH